MDMMKQNYDQWLLRPANEDPIITRIVKDKEPQIIPLTEDDEDWEVRLQTAGIKSWIGLPLIREEQVIGLLILDHDRPGYYTDAYRDILVLFASQAALAIEKNNLFDSHQAPNPRFGASTQHQYKNSGSSSSG